MGPAKWQTLGSRNMKPVLHGRGLSIGYLKRPVLQDLSFGLMAGELVSLIGVNGSGKSTLLRTLAGLQPPLAGEVHIGGHALARMSSAERARHISVVLTGRPGLGLLDVYTLVSLGRQPWTGRLGGLSNADQEKVELAMDQTGMASFATRSISALSDGELQKVLIARALAQDTPLMLLDEPTAFLDLVNRVKIMQLLRQIVHRTGRTIMLSTHDLQMAMRLSDRLVVLEQPGVWAGTPMMALEEGVLERAFSQEGTSFDPVTMSFE